MKILIAIVGMLFFIPAASTQVEINLDIDFETYQIDYQPLEEYVNLTEEWEVWKDFGDDFFSWDTILTKPVLLPTLEDHPIVKMEIYSEGTVFTFLDLLPEVPFFIEFAVYPFNAFLISPLYDENNEDRGDILYHYDDGISIIEFRNVAFEDELEIEDGLLISRANFQVHINHDNAETKLIYGPSQISPELGELFSQLDIIVGLSYYIFQELQEAEVLEEYKIGLVSGNVDNPDFQTFGLEFFEIAGSLDFISGIPEEGTVFHFELRVPTSTDQIETGIFPWSLHPNPTVDEIFIDFGDNPNSIGIHDLQIFDIRGHLMMEKTNFQSQSLNVSSWPSGIYLMRIVSEEGTFEKKWIKK